MPPSEVIHIIVGMLAPPTIYACKTNNSETITRKVVENNYDHNYTVDALDMYFVCHCTVKLAAVTTLKKHVSLFHLS